MANRHAITGNHIWVNKTDVLWHTNSAQGGGDGGIADGDAALFDIAGAWQINPTSDSLFGAIRVNTTGCTGTLETSGVVALDDSVFAAGTFTVGDDLTINGRLDFDGGALVVDNPLNVLGAFDETAGTLTGTGPINVAGDITVSGGTNTGHTGTVTQTASGNVNLPLNQRFGGTLSLGGTGVVSNLSGHVFANKVILGPSTVSTDAAKQLNITGAVNNAWVQDAANTLSVVLVNWYFATGNTNASAINVSGCSGGIQFAANSPGNFDLTLAGFLDAGARQVNVNRSTDGKWGGLVATGGGKMGALTLGLAGANTGGGHVTLSGNWTIGSIAVAAGSDAAENVFNFSTGTYTLSGTITGTGITWTNTSAVVIGGTITGVDLSASNRLLHILPVDDNSTNVNILALKALGTGANAMGSAAA